MAHPSQRSHHLLCIGLGFSATALAARLSREGWQVTATATRPEGVRRIEALGYRGHAFDGAARCAGLSDAIGAATHVVISVPPDADGDPVLRHHSADLRAAARLRVIAYLSTIGVYGDWAGAWVDETTELKPQSERSRRRAEAERAWLALGAETGKQVLVFRLAGIYGPGRSAIDNLLEGSARRIVKPGQVFNRIHVEDIAGVVAAAFRGQPRHSVYNVSDDEPCPPQDVVAYAAELLGRPLPPEIPFEQAALSPMGASFYAENKRASNARAKGDLGWRPIYPSYREGLESIAAVTRR
jgi:nucleoside-diphosphate-sugar epimerase